MTLTLHVRPTTWRRLRVLPLVAVIFVMVGCVYPGRIERLEPATRALSMSEWRVVPIASPAGVRQNAGTAVRQPNVATTESGFITGTAVGDLRGAEDGDDTTRAETPGTADYTFSGDSRQGTTTLRGALGLTLDPETFLLSSESTTS